MTGLVATEAWERFSYYGLRALLMLYLTSGVISGSQGATVLGLSQVRYIVHFVYGDAQPLALATGIVALFGALVWLGPIAGGLLGDLWLGSRLSVVLGGALLAAGYASLCSPPLLIVGLLLVVLGAGLFKPNIAGQLGALYSPGDTRRETGFALFYGAINVGAVVAPILCGAAAAAAGWRAGFALASASVGVGLAIYIVRGTNVQRADTGGLRPVPLAVASAEVTRIRVAALAIIFVAVVIMRVSYNALSSLMIIWLRDGVDRRLSVSGVSFSVPVTSFVALEPLCVVILTPLLAYAWARGEGGRAPPSAAAKLIRGFALVSSAYLAVAIAALLGGTGRASIVGGGVFVLLLAAGELHVFPTGLSLFPLLAPRGAHSTAVGVWYLASALGEFGAGFLARLWDPHRVVPFALSLAGIPLVSIFVVIIGQPLLRRAMAPLTHAVDHSLCDAEIL